MDFESHAGITYFNFIHTHGTVFMILGHNAARAAVLVVREGQAFQDQDYSLMQ